MGEAWEPETVFDVLASEEARRILGLAAREPRSAEELAERCGASLPTIYRRVNALEELDLLGADTRIDPDGNHFRRSRPTSSGSASWSATTAWTSRWNGRGT